MNIGAFTGSPTDNASGNHTAISGGRKPTADSHAYTLYKPNKANNRGKFSNGGGSISNGADQSFDAGYGAMQNNSIILMDKQNNNLNMSNFSTGPNTTASRFYNPKQQQAQSPQNNMMNET